MKGKILWLVVIPFWLRLPLVRLPNVSRDIPNFGAVRQLFKPRATLQKVRLCVGKAVA